VAAVELAVINASQVSEKAGEGTGARLRIVGAADPSSAGEKDFCGLLKSREEN